VHKLVRACALAAGVPERFAHPHAPRTFWASRFSKTKLPIHRVSSRLGHTDLRTTSRYAADDQDRVDDVADVLDRRHQATRRG
jgi:integrase